MTSLSGLGSLAFSGNTLSVAERAALRPALLKLKASDNLLDALFWGKITTAGSSYIIVVGLQDVYSGIPSKKFYVGKSGSTSLTALPDVTSASAERAAKDESTFTGNLEEGGDEAPEEEGSEEVYTEANRLAATIAAIDSDVSIVPRGSYIATPSHKVVRNRTYEGLSAADANSPSSYLHFRAAKALFRKSALERKGLVKSIDFMDSISDDLPLGQWAIVMNAAQTAVTLRNLVWPGYFFSTSIGSSEYGGAYFGNGLKNSDLVFMV